MKRKVKAFTGGWCDESKRTDEAVKEEQRYISVVPSERQLKYSEMEYYNFIHFGINTVNDVEWGTGQEDISAFCPEKLDTDQWCEVLKKTGSKGVIITAKHHDGFCLWNTGQTTHNVMNTPYGKDIVKSLCDSCKKYDLKLGIYLSPWDRHESTYGTEEYNDFFVAQLTELCTAYGKLFAVWFDGACGEGKNGKKQVYDWERYYSVVRKYQNDAVICICARDVRWIGNEGGNVRESEWSVVPAVLVDNERVMKDSQQTADGAKELARLKSNAADLGSRRILRNYSELAWSPAEADVSVNSGWFWHDNRYYLFKKKRTAKQLAKIYFNTVGANASLLLNVPPNRDGLIDKREIRILRKWKRLIDRPFEREIPVTGAYAFGNGKAARNNKAESLLRSESYKLSDSEFALRFLFGKKSGVKTIVLSEDIRFSQRVERFEVYAGLNGNYKRCFEGTVIGTKKMILLKKTALCSEIVIIFSESRSNPIIKKVSFYG